MSLSLSELLFDEMDSFKSSGNGDSAISVVLLFKSKFSNFWVISVDDFASGVSFSLVVRGSSDFCVFVFSSRLDKLWVCSSETWFLDAILSKSFDSMASAISSVSLGFELYLLNLAFF